MRGRLINPVIATFKLLDRNNTTYNGVYREPVGDRAETTIEIRCQVEEATWFRARFMKGGLQEDGEISLILFYKDLEDAGYLDTNQDSTINIQAKLEKLTTIKGDLIRKYANGLYVLQAKDSSYGLAAFGTPTRNLLFLLLTPRKVGA